MTTQLLPHATTAPQTSRTTDRLARALRELRISVTDRCQFRCRYCLPEEVFGSGFRFAHRNNLLSFEEIERLVRIFASLGVRKIRLTGGEPLLRREIEKLVATLVKIPGIRDVGLSTNGILLPPLAPHLADAGLGRVNVSLDSFSDLGLQAVTGRPVRVSSVIAGIDAAENSGLQVKVNAVIQRGLNETEIVPLAKFCRDRGLTLRFIEYMDVGNSNGWRRDLVVSGWEIRDELRKALGEDLVEERPVEEVARYWRYERSAVRIGFIESVTNPFCGGCTRARLTSTGELLTCLFASRGIQLLPLLRQPGSNDRQLLSAMETLWRNRSDRYSELRGNPELEAVPLKAEMWQVGG